MGKNEYKGAYKYKVTDTTFTNITTYSVAFSDIFTNPEFFLSDPTPNQCFEC